MAMLFRHVNKYFVFKPVWILCEDAEWVQIYHELVFGEFGSSACKIATSAGQLFAVHLNS